MKKARFVRHYFMCFRVIEQAWEALGRGQRAVVGGDMDLGPWSLTREEGSG